jgi:hypothetical protein
MKYLLLLSIAIAWCKPSWVLQGQSTAYKYPKFISASGASQKSMAEAEAYAMNGVSKQIKVHLSSKIKEIIVDYNQGEHTEEFTLSTSQANALVALKGVHIVERFEAGGEYYALAAIDIEKQILLIRQKIADIELEKIPLESLLLAGPSQKQWFSTGVAYGQLLNDEAVLVSQMSLIKPSLEYKVLPSPKVKEHLMDIQKSIAFVQKENQWFLDYQGVNLRVPIRVKSNKKWSDFYLSELGYSGDFEKLLFTGFSWFALRLEKTTLRTKSNPESLPSKSSGALDKNTDSSKNFVWTWNGATWPAHIDVYSSRKMGNIIEKSSKTVISTKQFWKCSLSTKDSVGKAINATKTATSLKKAQKSAWSDLKQKLR